jgi:hypothetical protein
MPNRWPITSGNWSNSAIWSGSIIPTASDDVFLNNQTVTLDQDVTVQSIRNTATGSVLVNGQLDIRGDYNITATGAGLIGGSLTITYFLIRYFNSGSITIQSNFPRANSGLDNTSSGTINIQGNITGTGYIGSIIVRNSGTGTLNITGSILPGSVNSSAVVNTSTGVINITGSATGGTATSTVFAISNTSTGTINVIGNVVANISPAISSTTGGTIIVSGPIISSPISPGISSTSTSGTVRVSGPLISQNNVNAVFSPKIQLISNSTPAYTFQSDTFGKDVTFYDVSYTSSLPAQTDVRSGSLYGGTNEYSGSMIIPSTSSVRYGVPVDTVTGSATLTPQDILNYATQNLTGSNTIGARLKNIATVQTTAATIAAFKGK